MADITLARSFLFLPADRLERLPKALASGAHALILDLEDAVAPERKADALARHRQWRSHGNGAEAAKGKAVRHSTCVGMRMRGYGELRRERAGGEASWRGKVSGAKRGLRIRPIGRGAHRRGAGRPSGGP